MTFKHTPRPNPTRGRSIAAAIPVSVLALGMILAAVPPTAAQELVIGEELAHPGIVFIFEGAVRDHVAPESQHLHEDLTHVHIEARVNWAETGIPEGTPPGGFVPYLNINALVHNEVTDEITFVSLLPHINLIDNFHYARNMQLPGGAGDSYAVYFYINPPGEFALARHRDWLNNYGRDLMQSRVFIYRNVNFMEIVTAPPRQSAYETPLLQR